MDSSNEPIPAGFGRARARARGRSPGALPSPDPSLLTSVDASSSHGESSSSTGTPSGVAQVIPQMEEIDLGEAVGVSGLPRGAMRGHAHTPLTTLTERERAEIRDERRDFVVTRPEGSNKHGQKGRQINIRANYFRLREMPTWSLQQYSVKFEVGDERLPSIDRISIRKKLFKRAMAERQVGIGYMFDGAQLYTARRLEDNNVPLEMMARLDHEEDPQVAITVTYIGKVDPGAPIYVQLHNILIRKCLFAMKLQEMGRNFFDPKAAIKLPQQKLELWPGFVTSMRTHEKDVLLCVEITHKVLRTDSVLQILRGIQNNNRGDDRAKRAAVVSELKDTVVMTIYNKETYHVDDLDFDKSPRDTFECKGEQVSYADYYQRKYGLRINDLNQPLIVCRPSKRDAHRGKGKEDETPQAVLLIPELCQSTGLTDAMRADYRLMSELSKYLHQLPKQKVQAIENFMHRLMSNDEIRAEFQNWGLEFVNELVSLQGRVLGNETIKFANGGTQPVDQKGDFTMAFRCQKMLSAVQMNNWVVLVPQRDAQQVDNLVRTMSKVATPLNMRIANPNQILILPDTRPQTYLRFLDEAINANPGIQMLFVILPTNKLDLYASVKKRLAVDQGIPSQCFLSKNVTSKGLMSIATKVVVQMNAKLGGEPWSVKLPLKNTMFVGFDVHKGGKNIIGAMVATFSSNFTKYYSTTTAYKTPAMISTGMQADLKKCVLAYQEENNGVLPESIFMYRDGVGEGQLRTVFHVELAGIKDELRSLYEAHNLQPPGLTYIVVSKRINTRLIEMKATGYDNPPPGTVVDSVVTLPERYDFYLISCGARQGTVSPCSYNVLCDESGLDADKIQLITYKMCHLYFNWSGTIAVPAPCQYAHKLAFLTGMAYSGQANAKLSKLLHFL